MGQPYAPTPFPQQGVPQPPKKGMSCGMIALIAGVVAVPVIVVLATIAIAGVRHYVAASKAVEAKVTVAAIYRAAADAHDRNGKLCGSSTAVPSSAPAGSKVVPGRSDFEHGDAETGWPCLKFSSQSASYFSYRYERESDDAFVVTAHGDLDADGNVSTFRLRGRVEGGRVSPPPQLEIIDELE